MNNAGLNTEWSKPGPTRDGSSPHEALSAPQRYAVAVLCVLIAFAVRYWLSPILGEELPFMLFVAASLVAAWYGGAVTGVVALLLGLFLASYFFPGVRVNDHLR